MGCFGLSEPPRQGPRLPPTRLAEAIPRLDVFALYREGALTEGAEMTLQMGDGGSLRATRTPGHLNLGGQSIPIRWHSHLPLPVSGCPRCDTDRAFWGLSHARGANVRSGDDCARGAVRGSIGSVAWSWRPIRSFVTVRLILRGHGHALRGRSAPSRGRARWRSRRRGHRIWDYAQFERQDRISLSPQRLLNSRTSTRCWPA
jgi:hypothetical protein